MSPQANNLQTPCEVLYRDQWLLIVNKPDGILSHPNPARSGQDQKSAFSGRYDLSREIFTTPQGALWLMHRLDQDASGILIAALDAETAKRCKAMFESGTIRKFYSTLLAGIVSGRGTWADHLAVTKGERFVRTSILRGRPPNSRLAYKLVRFYPRHQLSLIEIDLITGKTHQIRIQAASRRHPVAGDEIYGNFALNKELRRRIGLRRLFLHAHTIEMNHPVTGKLLRVESPLPEKLASCLDRLE